MNIVKKLTINVIITINVYIIAFIIFIIGDILILRGDLYKNNR